jgi:Predicted membrane protein
MRAHRRREVALAAGLSGVAGFVDAVAYVHLGGYFVSFMSGNSTRGGVELANGSVRGWALALGLVASFAFGVMCGTALSRVFPRHHRSVVLVFVSVALTAAALSGTVGQLSWATAPLMALAMGSENAVFQKNGEVTIGLTYMTGTLVKMAQHLTAALFGGPRTAWLRYFALWGLLSLGAITGAASYGWIGLGSLWIAVALSSVAVLISARYVR